MKKTFFLTLPPFNPYNLPKITPQKWGKMFFEKNGLNCAKWPDFMEFNEIEARKKTKNVFFLVYFYSLLESRPQFFSLLYSIQIAPFPKSRTTLHTASQP